MEHINTKPPTNKLSIHFACRIFLMLTLLMIFIFSLGQEVQAAFLGKVTVNQSTQTMTSVTLSWNKVSGADGYQIYRQSYDGQSYQRIKVVGAAVNRYVDSGLKTSKGYRYRVRAYKKVGKKYTYSTYNTLQACTLPERPALSVDFVTSNSVSLKWNSVPRITGYRIYRRLPGQSWTMIAKVPANTTTYTDGSSSLNAGTVYQYTVRAYRTIESKSWLSSYKAVPVTTSEEESIGSTEKLTPMQKVVMRNIIYAVESGGQVYGECDYSAFIGAGANTPNEVAITIGAGQWYATEAQTLLKKIYTLYPDVFKKYDKNGALWKDVMNEKWSTYNVSKTSVKGKRIISIISTPEGKKCQDNLMLEQITDYETLIREKYGPMNAKAMMECINIIHQGGDAAVRRILGKTTKPYTLDKIYATLNKDPEDTSSNNQVGDYVTRQKAVYTYINRYAESGI